MNSKSREEADPGAAQSAGRFVAAGQTHILRRAILWGLVAALVIVWRLDGRPASDQPKGMPAAPAVTFTLVGGPRFGQARVYAGALENGVPLNNRAIEASVRRACPAGGRADVVIQASGDVTVAEMLRVARAAHAPNSKDRELHFYLALLAGD